MYGSDLGGGFFVPEELFPLEDAGGLDFRGHFVRHQGRTLESRPHVKRVHNWNALYTSSSSNAEDPSEPVHHLSSAEEDVSTLGKGTSCQP